MSRNALKDDGRLFKMRQEEPEMLEALEENLADFHGRKEKSSTWWCPRLKGSHPERKKETFNFLNLMSGSRSYLPAFRFSVEEMTGIV